LEQVEQEQEMTAAATQVLRGQTVLTQYLQALRVQQEAAAGLMPVA
tara:strand:- start:462 stop:599 length:138 start_codon:yes stop_codon:yes gene_type:complete